MPLDGGVNRVVYSTVESLSIEYKRLWENFRRIRDDNAVSLKDYLEEWDTLEHARVALFEATARMET